MAATQSPGGGGLRQGVKRKELTWQVGGMAGSPACLRRGSRGREGAGLQAVGRGPKWDGSLRRSRAEEGCHLEVGVKIPLMVTGGATEEAVRSLSKAEETEV